MRTRALIAGIATAVALVLVGGVVAALELDGRPAAPGAHDGRLSATQVGVAGTVDGELASEATALALPAPTPPGLPPAPPGAPVPTGTVDPSTTITTTTAPPTGAAPTMAPPPSATPPPAPLSTVPPSVPPVIVVPESWSAESDGTTITVRIGTTSPKAGQPVEFAFEYSSQYPCCDLLVDFGDGSGFQDDAGVTCPEDPPRQPGRRRATTTHTYASAGTFILTVGVVAHARCVFPFPQFHSASVSGAMVVAI